MSIPGYIDASIGYGGGGIGWGGGGEDDFDHGGDELEPPQAWWTGFSPGQMRNIDLAINKALELFKKGDCANKLSATEKIDTSKLEMVLNSLLLWVKPVSADPSGTIQGSWRIFNGDNSQFPGVPQLRASGVIPGADIHGGDPSNGVLFLFPLFFNAQGGAPIGPDISRAILFIHEAVHLTGLKDTAFGSTQGEGSANLSDLIVKSCWSAIYGAKDLSFPIP